MTHFDPTPHRTRCAGLIDTQAADPHLSRARQLLALLTGTIRPGSIPRDAPVVLATTVGEIDDLERDVLAHGAANDAGRFDALFAHVCALFGTTGRGLWLSAACASSTAALAHAADRVTAGAWDMALVVAVDTVSEFVFSGFSSLMALDPTTAKPFDRTRGGLSLGEAAGYALVMDRARAERERRPVLAHLAGWGLASDANHMTGPSRDGGGLARAISAALRRAGVDPCKIGSVSAHGTGTAYNDAMEIKALRKVFGDRVVPTYGIKGAIGHTLGAAGLIETLIAARSLREGKIPPTVGLSCPDDDAAPWVSTESVTVPKGQPTLSINAGFGGVNAAIVLQPPDPTPSEHGVSPTAGAACVTGAAWIDASGCTALCSRETRTFGPGGFASFWKTPGRFAYPVKHAGRFDRPTRMACAATALALRDAGIDYGADRYLSVGLIGTNRDGCGPANRTYFEDYIQGGRTLGRGNLFLYTLPSSPLAETGIHFRCTGPTSYIAGPDGNLGGAIWTANRMLETGEVEHMLVIDFDAKGATCVVLSQVAQLAATGLSADAAAEEADRHTDRATFRDALLRRREELS